MIKVLSKLQFVFFLTAHFLATDSPRFVRCSQTVKSYYTAFRTLWVKLSFAPCSPWPGRPAVANKRAQPGNLGWAYCGSCVWMSLLMLEKAEQRANFMLFCAGQYVRSSGFRLHWCWICSQQGTLWMILFCTEIHDESCVTDSRATGC